MIWLPIVGNYCEIDAYASILAYVDLLNQRHKPAKTYIPFTPNYSVPAELRITEFENTNFDIKPNNQAIILDVSVPEAINKLVPDNQILELIDHHPGYEEYWHEKIGDRAIIEPIGAVATSIFEWWGQCWDYEKMSPAIAKLLLAAILDNTLNFNANITTNRDRNAANQLAELINITVEDFAAWYFSKVAQTVISDLQNALSQDSKFYKSPIDDSNLAFGQLTLWDTNELTNKSMEISKIMQTKAPNWIVSIINISKKRNYILAGSKSLTQYFNKILELHPEKNWLVSNQLYLRKEIASKMLKS